VTRILLATEGTSDEAVACGLIKNVCDGVVIDSFRFPARGFPIVKSFATTLARAAYFGFYDALVVDFDIDDGLDMTKVIDGKEIEYCTRWQDMARRIHDSLNSFQHIGRTTSVKVVFMSGCQSTDAWLMWAVNGGPGKQWECRDRHELKIRLYGNPPLRMSEKAPLYVERLIDYMPQNSNWPLSLRFFMDQLSSALATQS
jgi:hypothetical protein